MKKTSLKATTLRKIMITTILIIIGILSAGFYFGQDWLSKYANQTNSTTSNSSINGVNSQSLRQIQDEISKNKSIGSLADNMTASKQDYQNQIKTDLEEYASNTGISITNYDWSITPVNNNMTVNNLDTKFVKITINNPVPLKNLIQFFKGLESNLPKIQITDLNLNPSSTSKDNVTVDPITIMVYTKQ